MTAREEGNAVYFEYKGTEKCEILTIKEERNAVFFNTKEWGNGAG